MRWTAGVLAALSLALASCGGGGGERSKEAIPLGTPEAQAGAEGPPKRAGTSERGGLAIGIGDQRPDTFSDPQWRALGVKRARLIVPWNAIYVKRDSLDRWLRAAWHAGVEPLVAFNHRSGDHCPGSPCSAPGVDRYRRAFRAFRAAYPWVRAFAPWNEANHQSQPTARRPRRAAQYYNVIRANCRACRIVAADVLDSPNMRAWLEQFQRYARGTPKLWGLHNYTDTNRFRARGTRALLGLVKGEVWLTETGGVVYFATSRGKVALPYDERRAARSIDYAFRLAAIDRRRIKRVYLYQWRKTNPFDRFDAGIVRPSGRPRPSLNVLRRRLGLSPLPGVTASTQVQAAAEEPATIAPPESSTTLP